jgi:hypothetical protein
MPFPSWLVKTKININIKKDQKRRAGVPAPHRLAYGLGFPQISEDFNRLGV